MSDTKIDTPTKTEIKSTPNKDAVERIVATKGWEVRELRPVTLFQERVVLKLPAEMNLRTGKVQPVYIRADSASFEGCYAIILEKLAARGIEVV